MRSGAADESSTSSSRVHFRDYTAVAAALTEPNDNAFLPAFFSLDIFSYLNYHIDDKGPSKNQGAAGVRSVVWS